MNKVKSCLLALVGVLALTACGDDVTEVYEAESDFSSVASLKDIKCTADNEGEIVFSKEDRGMFTCANGEWTSVTGENTSVPHCETKTLKDSSGIAIYCDGDSVGVLKNGKKGADGKSSDKDASCSIDSVSTDSVWIACGKEVTAISLLGKNAETYSRTITVARIVDDPSYMSMLLSSVPLNVTVSPLNEKLEISGQPFFFNVSLDSIENISGRSIAFFTGVVSATTNEPYALIRAEHASDGFSYGVIVDLRDQSPVTITSLSDMKVDRVKKLVANGATFDAAMKQANEELYKVYGVDFKELVETKTVDKDVVGMMEILFVADDYASYDQYIFDYMPKVKSLFAEKGSFNTPFSVAMENEKIKMLPIDPIMDLIAGGGEPPEDLRHIVNFMFEEEYGLPSCKDIIKDTAVIRTSKDTYLFSYLAFACFGASSVWVIAPPDLVEALLDEETILAQLGECSAANEWEVVNGLFPARCEKDGSGKYAWRTEVSEVEKWLGFCGLDKDGRGVNANIGNGWRYYGCRDYQWTEIQAEAFADRIVCDSKTRKDTILFSDGDFKVCRNTGTEGESVYLWKILVRYCSSGECAHDADSIATILWGKCSTTLKGSVKSYKAEYDNYIYFECDGSEWLLADEPIGVCNEEKVGKIFRAPYYDGSFEYVEKMCVNVGSAENPNYEWQYVEDLL